MPKPEFRMHENPKRRRPQPFRPHRPLLERHIRLVARINRPRADSVRDLVNDNPRPRIQRIGDANVPRPPLLESAPPWPTSSIDLAGTGSSDAKLNPPRIIRPCPASRPATKRIVCSGSGLVSAVIDSEAWMPVTSTGMTAERGKSVANPHDSRRHPRNRHSCARHRNPCLSPAIASTQQEKRTSPLPVRPSYRRAPDFLVDDVGHFSPA